MDRLIQSEFENNIINLDEFEISTYVKGLDKDDYENFLVNMSQSLYSNLMDNLLVDKDFLDLVQKNEEVNLFETLSVSHLELWHSGLIKWIIDPKSDIGLGTFPLKRFLNLVTNNEVIEIQDKTFIPNINIASIETDELDLEQVSFKTELSFKNEGKNGRIDIFGENKNIRIVVENKIKAKESNDQTRNYFEWSELNKGELLCIYVFLTPDTTQSPKCDKFIKITYQNLCDYVIKPCLNHPSLKEEGKYLLNQYLNNLGKNYGGKKSMVSIDKEISQKIYNKHRIILDKIFDDVRGETPSNNRGNRSYNVELKNLIDAKLLHIDDILIAKYMGNTYEAKLIEDDGKIQIMFNGNKYNSPSGPAKEICERNTNGWTFWEVRDRKLSQLRDELPED